MTLFSLEKYTLNQIIGFELSFLHWCKFVVSKSTPFFSFSSFEYIPNFLNSLNSYQTYEHHQPSSVRESSTIEIVIKVYVVRWKKTNFDKTDKINVAPKTEALAHPFDLAKEFFQLQSKPFLLINTITCKKLPSKKVVVRFE